MGPRTKHLPFVTMLKNINPVAAIVMVTALDPVCVSSIRAVRPCWRSATERPCKQ